MPTDFFKIFLSHLRNTPGYVIKRLVFAYLYNLSSSAMWHLLCSDYKEYMYQSYTFRLFQRSYHQAVNQNCKMELIYIKTLYGRDFDFPHVVAHTYTYVSITVEKDNCHIKQICLYKGS